MIQRIQTLYMLLGAVASLLLAIVFDVWYTTEGVFKTMDNPVYGFFAGVNGGMLLANIFNFKKRKLQVSLNRIILFLSLVLAGLMIYEYVTLVMAETVTGPGIGLVMPLVTIVFIVMANKAIIKDENLVRSADRFR